MPTPHLKLVISFLLLSLIPICNSDGQRDHGEACSLRSQIANLFRENDSPEGCISAKGLVCVSHKCVCGDPSDIYEIPETKPASTSISGQAKQAASSFIGTFFGGKSTTTPSPPTSTDNGGRCAGRAGSPCFRTNSTCVEHAVCEPAGFGSVQVCKCQGIYSSNQAGMCSKSASALKQAFKYGAGSITG